MLYGDHEPERKEPSTNLTVRHLIEEVLILTDEQQKHRGGRPPKPADERADEPLTTHANKRTAQLIRGAAAAEGVSLSVFILTAAIERALQRGLEIAVAEAGRPMDTGARERQERALFHLRKIGTNANTLARAYHSSRRSGNEPPPTESEIDHAAAELRDAIRDFRGAFGL
jgi:hypothetical protein